MSAYVHPSWYDPYYHLRENIEHEILQRVLGSCPNCKGKQFGRVINSLGKRTLKTILIWCIGNLGCDFDYYIHKDIPDLGEMIARERERLLNISEMHKKEFPEDYKDG